MTDDELIALLREHITSDTMRHGTRSVLMLAADRIAQLVGLLQADNDDERQEITLERTPRSVREFRMVESVRPVVPVTETNQ